MNIENIDMGLLIKLLSQLNECIGCDECPFYEECEESEDTTDCITFYLQKISKNS